MPERLRQISTIARMTFLDARRNRATIVVAFFALLIVVSSFVFQEVTTAALDRVVRDVALASIHLFGLILAVFLGASAVSREMERKTVYLLVSKPLRRGDYVFGKLVGVWLTLLVILGLMTVTFLLQQLIYGAPLKPILVATCWLILMELTVIASFSIFGSTFASPLTSSFMSVGLFVIGELSSHLYAIADRSPSGVLKGLLKGVFYVLPHFERLNLKTAASLMEDVSLSTVLFGTAYASIYILCFTAGAIAIFGKRDLR